MCFFFFQAEDGIRDIGVTGVQTCALPICLLKVELFIRDGRLFRRDYYPPTAEEGPGRAFEAPVVKVGTNRFAFTPPRSEEHTSELQSRQYLVCRLLLVNKN